MSKEVAENVEGVETRGRARKASHSRDILSALKDRVVTLEEFVGDVKEMIDEIDDRVNDGLLSMKEQLRDYVLDSIDELTSRDDAIEAMMTALKKEIVELKGELTIYKAALGNGGLAAVAPKPSVDVPKPKEFKGTRSIDTKQELERRGVQELTKAMSVAESLAKFGGKKDRPESSKPKFNPKGNSGGD
ncbi:hypothetical protein J1N35_022614 [Gossypium stocksii]|uniref:Uncharacterized protein n=1 Tax=Gossypium stocksii TaxID=47602 RepID=A0A9D4A2F5_9ROSI|nr:hypothetical protein J1N35_022614 [Gossypium stocksii]